MTSSPGRSGLGDHRAADELSQVVEAVHRRVLEQEDLPTASPAELHRRWRELVRSEAPLLAGVVLDDVLASLDARITGLGPLQPFLDDPEVSEVMVNGGGAVWVERAGLLEESSTVLDDDVVLHLTERIVAPLGRHVDRASPMVDARLPDGSRVNAIVPPLAIDGPCLTIRRFGSRVVALDEFASPGVVALLRWSVSARANVLVSGGTGAGKTTLLNALAAEIPGPERVVTIEDAAELRLPGRHVIRLEARPPNAEGAGEVRVRQLVRNALRMRPDRLVVGEVRSGEALDMLQAMNTGHDGSLSTCHANRPADALRRLETLVLMGDVSLPLPAVREQIGSALDFVVHVARTGTGRRRVVAVDEVVAPLVDGGPLTTRGLVDHDVLGDLPRRDPRVDTPALDPVWLGR